MLSIESGVEVGIWLEVLDGWSVMVITGSAVTLMSMDVGTTTIEAVGLYKN